MRDVVVVVRLHCGEEMSSAAQAIEESVADSLVNVLCRLRRKEVFCRE